jgi:hypothetical protein
MNTMRSGSKLGQNPFPTQNGTPPPSNGLPTYTQPTVLPPSFANSLVELSKNWEATQLKPFVDAGLKRMQTEIEGYQTKIQALEQEKKNLAEMRDKVLSTIVTAAQSAEAEAIKVKTKLASK